MKGTNADDAERRHQLRLFEQFSSWRGQEPGVKGWSQPDGRRSVGSGGILGWMVRRARVPEDRLRGPAPGWPLSHNSQALHGH